MRMKMILKAQMLVMFLTFCAVGAGELKCNGKCKCYGTAMDCSAGNFKEIHFQKNIFEKRNIKKIYLRRNNISSLSLYKYTFIDYKVEEINLDSNRITSIVTDNIGRTFPMLKKLSLLNNKISSVRKRDFYFVTNLEVLDLGNNKITDIADGSFDAFERLEKLYLDRNELKTFKPSLFQGLQNLKVLSANHNLLTVVDHKWLDPLSSLRKLSLSFNFIAFIRPYDMKWAKSLAEIDLSHNKLQFIPNLPSFEALENGRTPGDSWFIDLRNNSVNCDCHLSSFNKFLVLQKFVCGIFVACNFGTSKKNEHWAAKNVCSVDKGMTLLVNFLKQPICQAPKLKLLTTNSSIKTSKPVIQCVGYGYPVPEVKIRQVHNEPIFPIQITKNMAMLEAEESFLNLNDYECVATNNVASVRNSLWLSSRDEAKKPTQATSYKTLRELYSQVNLLFPLTVAVVCLVSNMLIISVFIYWKCQSIIHKNREMYVVVI